MQIKKIRPDVRLLRATAPAEVAELALSGEKEIQFFAAFEKEELLTYGLFSHFSELGTDVYLEYFYTMPEHRGKGCFVTLLEECGKLLAEAGFENILLRRVVSYEEAEEFDAYTDELGFIPLNLGGRLLEYRLSDLLASGAFQTIAKNKKLLSEVQDVRSIGEDHFRRLSHKLEQEQDFTFVRDEATERYSRFCLEDSGIEGAMIATKPDKDLLYISALYLPEGEERSELFLPMLAGCVEEAFEDEADGRSRVRIRIDNEELADELMSLFNPPDREQMVLEYMLPITAKGGMA